MEAIGFAVPLIISVVSAIIAVATLLRQIKRDKPDIAETYENMATRQADKIIQLQKTVDELECEVRRLRKIVESWPLGIATLINQLEECGETPRWNPENLTKG